MDEKARKKIISKIEADTEIACGQFLEMLPLAIRKSIDSLLKNGVITKRDFVTKMFHINILNAFEGYGQINNLAKILTEKPALKFSKFPVQGKAKLELELLEQHYEALMGLSDELKVDESILARELFKLGFKHLDKVITNFHNLELKEFVNL